MLFNEMWVRFNLSLRIRLPGPMKAFKPACGLPSAASSVELGTERQMPGAMSGQCCEWRKWGWGCQHRLPGCPEKVTVDWGAVGREECSRPRDQQVGRAGGAEGAGAVATLREH